MKTYTLVAYKPNGESWNCGSSCCGKTRSDSGFVFKRGLTVDQLAEEIAKIRVSYVEGRREEYRGEPFEVHYFDDTGMSDWESNEEREDYWEEEGFWKINQKLETLISTQEPIIKQREEQEAKEKAAREAEEARVRRVKYEAGEREKRDREEFARLSAKFKEAKP